MTPTCGIRIAARSLRPACSLFLAGPQPLRPWLLAEGEPAQALMAPICTDPTPVGVGRQLSCPLRHGFKFLPCSEAWFPQLWNGDKSQQGLPGVGSLTPNYPPGPKLVSHSRPVRLRPLWAHGGSVQSHGT